MSIEIAPCEDINVIAPILKLLRGTVANDLHDTRLKQALSNGYRCFVTSDANGLLGYQITYDVFWGKTFYIDDLVVEQKQPGSGIGARLIERAKREAHALDCDHIRLCSGLARADAHRFYEQNCFAKRAYNSPFLFQKVRPDVTCVSPSLPHVPANCRSRRRVLFV